MYRFLRQPVIVGDLIVPCGECNGKGCSSCNYKGHVVIEED